MDIDSFRGQPFDAAGEAVPAGHAGQGAEAIAHQRPVPAAFGQAVVVVRLAVMDIEADALALADAVIEVTRHVRRRRNSGTVPNKPIACRRLSTMPPSPPAARPNPPTGTALREIPAARAPRCIARPAPAPCSRRRNEIHPRRAGTRSERPAPTAPTTRPGWDSIPPSRPTSLPTRPD